MQMEVAGLSPLRSLGRFIPSLGLPPLGLGSLIIGMGLYLFRLAKGGSGNLS